MRAWTVPAASSSEQSRSATVGPKDFVTPSIVSRADGGACVIIDAIGTD
jgi:hypothetical protein